MIFHTTQKLNFSQRNGLQKINEVLQVNSMSDELRTALFNFVYEKAQVCYSSEGGQYFGIKSEGYQYFGIKREIVYSDFFKEPLTDMPYSSSDEVERFEKWFFDCEWNKIYDFFEFCFSEIDSVRRENFTAELNSCLEKENSGYRMLNGCVVSITDELEKEGIKESSSLGKDEIKKHLDKSIEFLRNRDGKEPDFRNSIKESISAVEYVVRDITGASTLGDGLNKLEKKGIKINVCLKEAFDKLYAYTNSEDGIRHANMNNNNVSFDEAKFMLVVCSSFINYITSKRSQLKN